MIPPHQQKRKRHSTLIHRAPTLPQTQTPRQGMSEDRAGGQTDPEDAVERDWWPGPQNWEAIMEEVEGLTYDDPRPEACRQASPRCGKYGHRHSRFLFVIKLMVVVIVDK